MSQRARRRLSVVECQGIQSETERDRERERETKRERERGVRQDMIISCYYKILAIYCNLL